MRDRLFALLRIEPGEESMVLILLAQSVFLGIFFGAFDISAHALLLSVFDERMMARGYIVSGLTGIFLIILYTMTQSRMQIYNKTSISLTTVTALTLILWVTMILSSEKWVVFIVFVMFGPLNILAMLGFRETTDHLFSLSQKNRLIRILDTGIIAGIIIISYSIPVLLSVKFGLHNIFLVGLVSVLFASIIQMTFGARLMAFAGSGIKQPEKSQNERPELSLTVKDNLSGAITIYIVFSVITAFFIQYSFMAVTRERYPAGDDIAAFLGIFTGSMMVFSLFLNWFAFSWLIRNYGLRVCLVISPFLIIALTAIIIFVGLTMGYTPESSGGFILFFLLLALSRLFSKSLKEPIQTSSFKVIFNNFDDKPDSYSGPGIFSTVNEIAVISVGLILSGLGILGFIKLIHFSLFLFFIVLLWGYISFRVYKKYRLLIRKKLEGSDGEKTEAVISNEYDGFKSRFSGYLAFRNDYFSLISSDFAVLDSISNRWYFKYIIDFSGSKDDINLLPALNKISLKEDIEEGIRQHSVETVEILEKIQTEADIENNNNEIAKTILSGTRLPQTTKILRLLRDNSIESKKLAIYMIGKFKLNDMLPDVSRCLNIRELEKDAYNVLLSFDKEAVDELIRYYMISSGNINASKSILRLLGKASAPESLTFLFSRLWSNSRHLKEVALQCLIDCHFSPSPEDKDKLIQLIDEIAMLLSWNLSAKICLKKNNDIFLSSEMQKETDRWIRFLFNILSITYHTGSVNKIRENIDRGTEESVVNAFEMMDIVIDNSLIPSLKILFDIVSDEEKHKKLNHNFPVPDLEYNILPEDLINRDYNILSLWTKACALRNIKEINRETLSESVVALLFSPEELLMEEAARLAFRTNQELYISASSRIPESTKKHLEAIMNEDVNIHEMLFEKTAFLSGCFKGIPEDNLLPLSGVLSYKKGTDRDIPLFADRSLIWPLSDEAQGNEAFVYYIDDHKGWIEKNLCKNKSFYVLPLDSLEEYLFQYPEQSLKFLEFLENNKE